jgi:hypothetical protein
MDTLGSAIHSATMRWCGAVLGCLPAEATMRGYFVISTRAEFQTLVLLEKGSFIR